MYERRVILIKYRALTLFMEEQQDIQRRFTAYKVSIGEVVSAQFVKGDGWALNSIGIGDLQVFRVNVLGIVVDKDDVSITIEDGSGRLQARFFQDPSIIAGVSVGNLVMVVGRPRIYENEVYIMPEIVTVLDKEWMDVRKKELEHALTERLQGAKRMQSQPIEAESPMVNESEKNKKSATDEVMETAQMQIRLQKK